MRAIESARVPPRVDADPLIHEELFLPGITLAAGAGDTVPLTGGHKEVAMTSTADPADALPVRVRAGVRMMSGVWWWFLILGILWTGLGMYVLSYRAGSLGAVAALVGVAFLFGGVAQLMVASRVRDWRWLFLATGIVGVLAGILALAWPGITLYVVSILVAWYLVFFGVLHVIGALAGPKVSWWWTGLLLGIAELVLGVWAVHSWQRSLFTLLTLVGVWAVFHGINEIFAAFTLREAGRRVEQLAS
jgi:uncharacterized membrane protein HdeD (DUF308 family)